MKSIAQKRYYVVLLQHTKIDRQYMLQNLTTKSHFSIVKLGVNAQRIFQYNFLVKTCYIIKLQNKYNTISNKFILYYT